jgi:hypothetical protein
LHAFDEHACDFAGILAIARAVREQVDWEDVRARTVESPFARAFFTLIEGLGIVGDARPPRPQTQAQARITVRGQPTAAGTRDERWQAPGRITTGVAAESVHEHGDVGSSS